MGKYLPKSPLPHPKTQWPCCSLNLFLLSWIWMKPFQWMSFCPWFQVMDPCFIPSDDPLHKDVTISLIIIQQIWTHFFPHSLVMVRLCSSQQEQIIKYPKASKILFTVPLDTERSNASFLLVVIHWSFQMSSLACWSNVWVTALVVQPEQSASTKLCLAFLRTC